MMVAKDDNNEGQAIIFLVGVIFLTFGVGLYVDPGLGLMVGGIILIAVALYESYFWPTKKG